jgi:hypothetical protein
VREEEEIEGAENEVVRRINERREATGELRKVRNEGLQRRSLYLVLLARGLQSIGTGMRRTRDCETS